MAALENRVIACIIIAGGKRKSLLEKEVIPSALAQPFDCVLVVGEHHAGEGYQYLHVPALTNTTTDALVKRDVGTLATPAELLLFLSDDHAVVRGVKEAVDMNNAGLVWDVMVPQRIAEHPEQGIIRIPNGETESYCGGHGGLFRRRVIVDRPWSAQQHHRLWDVLSSRAHQEAGFRYLINGPLVIEDMEPLARPWE